MLGNNVDGGYAEFIAVGAKDVFPLPPEIPLVDAAIIADALTTPYHAVINRGRVLPGDRVVVIARDRYTEAVADAFHQCEGYSRRLIDMAQRNESAPLTLRVRCALAMVRRDPSQKWLPHPIDDLDPNRLRFDDFFPQDLPYPEDVESISGQDFLDREERRQAERKELEQPRNTGSEQSPSLQRRDTLCVSLQALSANVNRSCMRLASSACDMSPG